jgi:hypothetical protein
MTGAPAAELRKVRLVGTQGVWSLAGSNGVSNAVGNVGWHDQVSVH